MIKIKRYFILILVITLIISNNIVLFAHSEVLDVSYDECIPERYVSSTNIGDGEYEKWYDFIINENGHPTHISHSDTVTTIKYYFNTCSEDNNESIHWQKVGITESQANEYKLALANSMKKWNNVYFYKYDEDGNVAKKKNSECY